MARNMRDEPSRARFLVKWTMSAMRACGSGAFQKACMMNVTGTRNSTSAATPTLGCQPSRNVNPATASRMPETTMASGAAGTPFDGDVSAHHAHVA